MAILAEPNRTHERFNGFEKFYSDTLQPYLLAREQERKLKYKQATKTAILVGLGGMAVSTLVMLLTKNPIFSLFSLGASGLLAFAIRAKIMENIKRETKQYIMSNICQYLGWTYQAQPEELPNLHQWYRNGLLPHWDRVNFEDEIKGRHKKIDFNLCEAHLEKEDRDSDGHIKWVTVFRGLLLKIPVHKKFYGRTVVLRDAGLFNRKKRAGMKRVGLVSKKFEKIFEAYGTDQVEARTFLTPDFMQKLIDLEADIEGKKIRFGFIEGRLMVAVETGNQFEAGSMSTPLTDRSRIDKILKELSGVMNIVEGLSTQVPRSSL